MFRRLILLAVAVVALSAAPAAAGGEGYTPTSVTGIVNDDGSVTVSGENCPPGGEVTYTVRRGSPNAGGNPPAVDSGSTTADADGSFEFTTAPLPNGQLTMIVTCGGGSVTLSIRVNQGLVVLVATDNGNQTLTCDGTNLPAGEGYEYVIQQQSTVGFAPLQTDENVVASASGTVGPDGSLNFTTPQLPVGRHLITVTSGDITVSTSAVVSSAASAASPSSPAANSEASTSGLAFTGSDASPFVQAGIALIAAGGVFLYASRRRRRRAGTSQVSGPSAS